MRRLCLTVGISAMLALPVWAQQGEDSTRDGGEDYGGQHGGGKYGGDHQCSSGGLAKQFCHSGPFRGRHHFRVRQRPRAVTKTGRDYWCQSLN